MGFPIVILGSGRGSNARAILEAQRAGLLGAAEVVAVFSDQPDAPILNLGKKFGLEARHLEANPGRASLSGRYEAAYIEAIRACQPRLVVLAGFMRILKPRLIEAFPQQIINLHPSLLPSFPGLDAIGQALRYGVKITGCTVHYVTPEVDAGPILAQRAVEIAPDDTPDTLAQKVHAAEHALLPEVVADLSRQPD